MTALTHLTIRDRRLLAGLGKRKPAIATPYTDRLRTDAVIAREAASKRAAEAAQRSAFVSNKNGASTPKANYTKLQKIVGKAQFSRRGVAVGVCVGALVVVLATQPVIDAAEAKHSAAIVERDAAQAIANDIASTPARAARQTGGGGKP